ncbi:hypothetical protein [Gilvimarinus sp. 1_MG-2023]|uniref:hypothetical protein n=1 Tax=Gilvimarinus sp. 1_MG-2023 TaxID=3062638 RepID=UPI0026E29FEC|nr:hypothetical protein [Gilvimarinus sp. 1_MG-2023]MDO6747094.1 hypothetical protein [Gilvimarinus sp. 1_MG-2023]
MTSVIRTSIQYLATFTLVTVFGASQALANGPIGEHVNHLQDNLGEYSEEVSWIIGKVDAMIATYEDKGTKAAKSERLIDFWEEVDFHSAIETNYVPVYASIWQGLYGIKGAIDAGKPIAEVRAEQEKLEQALWQALGAVKLAAKYQQNGLLDKIKTTAGPSTPQAALSEVNQRLDRVVAKYAEKLPQEATDIVHDTYLNLFEGVEGALIEQDASLVEDLEKDFNVTLPKAISAKGTVDQVRAVVTAMQGKIDQAKSLLEQAEKERKDVF